MSWWSALAAGGCAGLAVDLALYPLDTIKTRMQAEGGFMRAGGFKGMYRGLSAAAAASAPAAGAFFSVYEYTKRTLHTAYPDAWAPGVHMVAAVCGEMASAAVRVPFEVVKQQRQAGVADSAALRERSVRAKATGLVRSYGSLLTREIPFALLQYPLYERLKAAARAASANDASAAGESLPAWTSCLCGSVAGGISAAATTPLDVAKTRIMLAGGGRGVATVLADLYRREGASALFRGIGPRVLWISLGGAVFFGVYERALAFFETTALATA